MPRSSLIAIVAGIMLIAVGVIGFVAGWGSESGSSSASPATTTTTTTDESVAESPASFLAAYVTALREPDTAFLVDRLDPAVTTRYGTDQCRAAVAQLADPQASLQLVATSDPEDWDYTTDGATTSVPDTVTFTVEGTVQSASGQRDYHFALVDGKYRTFLDCGTPTAGES